jgi:hypothetical protein
MSKARQALSIAIKEVSELRKAAEAALSARERADQLVLDAEQRLADCRAKERASIDRRADTLINSIRAGEPAPSGDVIAARAATAEAEEALEAARAVLPTLDTEAIDTDAEYQRASVKLTPLADQVIIEEINFDDLVAQIERDQNALNAKRVALRWLEFNRCIPEEKAAAAKCTLMATNLAGGFGTVDWADWNGHPSYANLTAARERLTRDADAPLPLRESDEYNSREQRC